MDIEPLRQWIGREQTTQDVVTKAPVAGLAATLDRDDPPPRPGDPLPPLWHWLYFLPAHRQSELGHDGHAKLGGFLPPVPLPARMWAGGRLEFHRPLRLGEEVSRTSRIADLNFKAGRSGPLVFVVVRHEIRNSEGLAIAEEQDIVYRDQGGVKSQASASDAQPVWSRTIHPDDVFLFRYSALTFNGHRIHYDRRYAESEGYPGLVVHGPLIATLLLDLLRRNMPLANVRRFTFRALSPLFDGQPLDVCGRPGRDDVHLWARNNTGGLAMDATAVLASEP